MARFVQHAVENAPDIPLLSMPIDRFEIASLTPTLAVFKTPFDFEIRVTGVGLDVTVTPKQGGGFDFAGKGTATGLSRTNIGGTVVYEEITGLSVPFQKVEGAGLDVYIARVFAGDDVFTGSAAPDRFAASPGNDAYDGLGGFDVMTYGHARGDYVLTKLASAFEVRDASAGRDGTDRLTGIERIVFTDEIVALDEVAGQAYRVYQAAFARTPDKGGLSYWVDRIDDGASLRQVAEGFVYSDEFRSVYGASPTTEQIVARFYENVLGRPGEQGGVDFWVGEVNNGRSIADTLVGFSESPENKGNLAAVIGAGIALDPAYFV